MEVERTFENLSIELETSRGKALVFADPHIAFELSRGLRIRTKFERKLAEFVKLKNPDFVIILGDIKEPLGINTFTKRLLLGFFSELRDFEVIITRGNHDGKIEEVLKNFENVKVVGYYTIDEMLFLHGHQILPPEAKFEKAFLGHIHPAVIIKFGSTAKRVKCFLRIEKFLILPTINPYIEGFDVREGIKMIPFLKNSKEGDAYLPEGTYIGRINFI
ncbi:metallophosphoesterase [Thermococcus barophilus]|uniref:Metallophosphoesterase n=2 Tax=Thermococcus barophilus TaxID=55802 RepID=A0A0S1XD88_THEBA|nr:metallophosphoesterase [Thermococcus barophilus]ADT84711.1 exonuclease SbcD-like protein [Thermococcus barophilus MP]ALM75734.1 Metallophosphoesterase [Thermococcus barophilus]